MATKDLLEFTDAGIYCPQGDFYIDPWRKVQRAIITHGHSDHARRGMGHYLAHKHTVPVLRLRLGQRIQAEGVEFGEERILNGVRVSLHPAGHIIGSAQVRVEYKGQVAVASGDYKVEDDGVSGTFEPIPCNTFITETTFGMPFYRWQPQETVMEEINSWWASNAASGRVSWLAAYSLGKAQRLSEWLDRSIGPVFTHHTVEEVNQAFRAHGKPLKETRGITQEIRTEEFRGGIVIAPGSGDGSSLATRLGEYSLGNASGWMAVKRTRRNRNSDRGFVLSDHAGWDGLNAAIEATGATRVHVTHGYTTQFARWLTEKGIEVFVEDTLFEGEMNQE